ncbi:folylpolyglutamate synthase, mitochondrial-like isoform X2 [Octopus sinensis]|uniref:tetrahydrofolate synthase n=1 Tax=Octopus sinensis TaxID=2607531 RepID=A0A7E6ENZ5_9MOLL|nr:folylpolyglutamate synthase, mitochondrial-like isoform X2 [Octopus sinensis]
MTFLRKLMKHSLSFGTLSHFKYQGFFLIKRIQHTMETLLYQHKNTKLTASDEKSYDETIKTLNSLQSKKKIQAQATNKKDKLVFIRLCLENVGLTLKELDNLSVIHVAGTKGKGSTCFYTECILRNKGQKTGFFSSPHLIEVRERIRINGVPLSKGDFTKYFWICYNLLLPGSIAVTVPQKEDAMKILKQTATNKNCSLYLSPPFSSYEIFKENPVFCNKEPLELENMTLAVQLSRIWMDRRKRDTTSEVALAESVDSEEAIPFLHPVVEDVDRVIEALTSNQWLGRVQIVKRHNITYYLDGAHTEESIMLCCEWFKKRSAEEIRSLSDNQKVVKILMFNITGARNSLDLLNHLKECNFDLAVFTPNICYSEEVITDQLKHAVTTQDANKVCQTNENFWRNLWCNKSCGDKDKFLNNNKYNEPNQQPNSDVLAESETHVFESIHDCIYWCSQSKDKALNKRLSIQPSMPSILEEADHVQILVTGSLYLVGGVLTIFRDSI